MKKLALFLSFAAYMFGQAAAVAPYVKQQYFDNVGVVLSGGRIFTYAAGTTSPLNTFTDASGITANPNPVVLDASGRASIWLTGGVAYKFVLQTSAGLTLWTVDNITALTTNTGPFIQNGTSVTTAAGNKVGLGCPSPVSVLDVCGTSSGNNYLVRIEDSANSPGVNLIGAGNSRLGSIAADGSAAFRVRAGNDASQLFITQGVATFQDQTPSGHTTLNVTAGSSQGSTNLSNWNDSTGTNLSWVDSVGRFVSPLFNGSCAVGATHFTFQDSNSNFLVDCLGNISAVGAINFTGTTTLNNVVITGTCTGTACGGGGGGGSPGGVDTDIQINAMGAFGVASGGSGFKIAGYAAANPSVTLTTGTGGFAVTGNSTASFNAPNGGMTSKWGIVTDSNFWIEEGAPAISIAGQSRMYMDSGSHTLKVSQNGAAYATLAVGSATPPACSDTDIQVNISGSFGCASGGSTLRLSGDSGANLSLTLVSGTGGIASTSTSTAAFNAPNGGSTAAWHISTDSAFWIEEAAPAVSIAGQSRIYMDSTSHTLKCSQNGSAYATCLTGAGSVVSALNTLTGSLTINGTANEISVTPAGSVLTLATPQPIATSSTPTFSGVFASGAPFNSTAAGSAFAFITSNNNFLVDGNGNITFNSGLFGSGGFNLINSSHDGFLRNLTISGTCTGCGGGGGGVTSLTGTTNQVNVSAPTGAVTLSLPQSINTTANVNFASVTTSGTHQSTVAAGVGTAFNVSNGLGSPFIVDGQGDISGNGSINMLGNTGLGAYRVGGTVIVDNSRNLTNIASLTTSGAVIASGNVQALDFVAVGGFFGASGTAVIGGCTIFFHSGLIYSTSGC